MTDDEIIDMYFSRNEEAINETVGKYGRLIKSIANNILNSYSDSEECINDTYHAAWKLIPPEKPNNLGVFLGKIARNIALDKFDYNKASKRNSDFSITLSELEEIIPSKDSPELALEETELTKFINDFLRQSKIKSMLKRTRESLKKYLDPSNIGNETLQGDIVDTYNDCQLHYSSYTGKMVPGDYVMTEEDKQDEASGKYIFSYGASEISTIKVQGLSWKYDKVIYTMTTMDSVLTQEDLVQMAKEMIDFQ